MKRPTLALLCVLTAGCGTHEKTEVLQEQKAVLELREAQRKELAALAQREKELEVREERVSQTQKELEQARTDLAKREEEVANEEKELERVWSRIRAAEMKIETLEGQIAGYRKEIARLVAQNAGQPVTQQWTAQERIKFIEIGQPMQLFKIVSGRFPETHDEFMAKIVREFKIQWPAEFVYDPEAAAEMTDYDPNNPPFVRLPKSAPFPKGVKLPDDFPKDVPLYPGATVSMSGRQKQGTMVMFTSGDDRRKIASFYEAKLKENGWKIETSANIGEGSMFGAKKEKRQLSVGINEGQITIVVQEE